MKTAPTYTHSLRVAVTHYKGNFSAYLMSGSDTLAIATGTTELEAVSRLIDSRLTVGELVGFGLAQHMGNY
jgi:hypothetical protein